MKLSIILLAVAATPRAATADCNLATDDGVAAAYATATGRAMPEGHRCIRRSTTFPGLVAVGHFMHDYGCEDDGILVGCRLSPPGFAATAMAKAGWAKADTTKRTKLALAWLAEIEDVALLAEAAPELGKKFAPVSAVTSGNVLAIEAWLRPHVGMSPNLHFSRVRVTFAADGTHAQPVEIDSLTVPIQP